MTKKLISFAFWETNFGCLVTMMFILLPIGLMRTVESVNNWYWSARSPKFIQTDVMQFWRLIRVFGDTIFAIGAVAFFWFALGLIFSKPGKNEVSKIQLV